ncbi:MAG: hypothetical protein Tsb0010_16730 [Parvularculaceae bacterium]
MRRNERLISGRTGARTAAFSKSPSISSRKAALALLGAASLIGAAFAAAPARADDSYVSFSYGYSSHGYGGYRGHHRGYDRHYRGPRHRGYRPYGGHYRGHHGHGGKGSDAALIVGGAILGAVVIDALIDEQRDRDRYARWRDYTPYGNPGYQPAYAYQPPRAPYGGAPAAPPAPPRYDGRDGGYDYAYNACKSRAHRVMSEERIAGARMDFVNATERLRDGGWRISFTMSGYRDGHPAVRAFECETDARGVYRLDIR